MSDSGKRRYGNAAEGEEKEEEEEGEKKRKRTAANISSYITDTIHTHRHARRTSQTTVNLLSLAFVARICSNEGGDQSRDSHTVFLQPRCVRLAAGSLRLLMTPLDS